MKKIILVATLLISISVSQATIVTPFLRPTVDSVFICQSKSAYAYHSFECRGLAHCTHTIVKITKAQAIKLGYKACKICYR